MDPIIEVPVLGLDDTTNELPATDFVTDKAGTVSTVANAIKDEKNSIRDGNIDYDTRIKRHTERENEIHPNFILNHHQVRNSASLTQNSNFKGSFRESRSETSRESHLTEKIEKIGDTASVTFDFPETRTHSKSESFHSKLLNEIPECEESEKSETAEPKSSNSLMTELKNQNLQLKEAFRKLEKTHSIEKKRFHEVLFGIDKALSSLPLRLEQIRVKNQKNHSIFSSLRLPSDDKSGADEPTEGSLSEDSATEDSQESSYYLSNRMKCLLCKVEQVSELLNNIKDEDTSRIETLVDKELCAISLLKKEILSTKKQIEDNKTDSETLSSCERSIKETSAEEGNGKPIDSFLNELDKASNFKIFENHIILQEEALNLLTAKIKETEEALIKEVEEKERLRKELEAMEEEMARLKSIEEQFNREMNGIRPFKLIKELKMKLEDKEKTVIKWKEKYSRSEATNTNKQVLIDNEKKKNADLKTAMRNLKFQMNAMQTHIASLKYLNNQLKDQSELLKHQVGVLAQEKMNGDNNSSVKIDEETDEREKYREFIKIQESKVKKVEEEVEGMKEMHGKEVMVVKTKLKKSETMNEEFFKTIKELLNSANKFKMEKDLKAKESPAYIRIREILNISSSELELLFNSHKKNTGEEELDEQVKQCKSIIQEERGKFSNSLSAWLFQVISDKLLTPKPDNDK